MTRIKKKLIVFKEHFKIRHSLKTNHIVCFGKCIKEISKNAQIKIDGILNFNRPWTANLFGRFEIGHIFFEKGSKINIEENCIFRSGCKLEVFKDAQLIIGKNVKVNLNTTLYCRKKVTIGNDSIISENVVIRDSDIHHINGKENSKEIFIGNNVWIGTNVIILKGVTIGDGSVIAAGSVIVKDVPPNCIVGGNPQRIIQNDISWFH